MLPGTEQIVLYKDQKAVEIAACSKIPRQPAEDRRRAGGQQDHPLAVSEEVRHQAGIQLLNLKTTKSGRILCERTSRILLFGDNLPFVSEKRSRGNGYMMWGAPPSV